MGSCLTCQQIPLKKLAVTLLMSSTSGAHRRVFVHRSVVFGLLICSELSILYSLLLHIFFSIPSESGNRARGLYESMIHYNQSQVMPPSADVYIANRLGDFVESSERLAPW